MSTVGDGELWITCNRATGDAGNSTTAPLGSAVKRPNAGYPNNPRSKYRGCASCQPIQICSERCNDVWISGGPHIQVIQTLIDRQITHVAPKCQLANQSAHRTRIHIDRRGIGEP
ncbi:MAG: hypothetical protein IPJ40_17890 [Saprospirales bacterium]|nr:hypothetical protein [Saprospirales bacterium]